MSDPGEYAREVERYLCRKNGGHLVRVVGPAFEMVCGWAATGVPLKIALRGIDRCCERLEARGPRRRPVRIEFCEADVLDAFDDWRRAVGVSAAAAADEGDAPHEPRKPALAAHIERAIARLAHARGTGKVASPLQRAIEEWIRELEALAPSAARSRGDARATIVAQLARLDAALIVAAVAALDEIRVRQLRQEAAEELAPFGSRMPADEKTRALEASFHRLAREAAGLPVLRYE